MSSGLGQIMGFTLFSILPLRELQLQLTPTLGSKTGRRYRAIVEECLGYEEAGKEGRTPHQMMEWVVLSLEALRV